MIILQARGSSSRFTFIAVTQDLLSILHLGQIKIETQGCFHMDLGLLGVSLCEDKQFSVKVNLCCCMNGKSMGASSKDLLCFGVMV